MTSATAFDYLLPLVTGALVPRLLDAIKRDLPPVDGASRTMKQSLAFALAGALTTFLTLASTWAGFPNDLVSWRHVAVQSVVGGLIAITSKQQAQVDALKARVTQSAPTA